MKTAKDLISDGSIEAAVVSVSSNLADPKYNYLYMTLDLVSPDEFCRSFDKNGNYSYSNVNGIYFLVSILKLE